MKTYKCEIHGELSSEWCDDCGKIVEKVQCNHAKKSWYNGYIETINGTVEVEVLCCETCGIDIDARLKHHSKEG